MKRSVLVVILVLVVFGIAACTRQLSTPGASQPAEATAPPVAGNVMDQLQQFATQTAIAGGAAPVVVETAQAPQEPTAESGEPLPGEQPAEGAATPQAPQPTPAEVVVVPAQPVQPAIVVPTSTPGIPKTYTIERGESAYCIARRFDLDPQELLSVNGLGANTIIQPGTVLKIPQTGNPFPAQRALRPHPATYAVSGNESLNEIACYYGDVSPEAIAFANGLQAPYRLKAGMNLQIP